MAVAGVVDPIRSVLEASRQELLDLGLRNPLIDQRPSRSRGVEITDERAVDVFRILVTDGTTMDFLATPDDDDAGDLPQPGPARHVDTHLQTTHGSSVLQRRLFNTAHDARTLMEEQGVNLCSLALGTLHWLDDDGKPRRAPLLLVPVLLERASARSRYVVRHSGEEPGPNLALSARLRADQALELPPLGDDLDAWFAEVAERLAHIDGWRVEPDEMSVGLFSFARFLLYRDLDPDAWPKREAPARHRVVRAVLGEGFPPAAAAAPEIRVFDVLDADGSQAAVLADVAAGRDLVVQGPPGTGKSQTIANLVAAAVAAGKRVLFVAEKMAALEVVMRRLDGAGLGALCLELHSRKSNKRAVLEELSRTLALARPERGDADTTRAALDDATARLDAYRDALVTPVGGSGVSPYEAIGRRAAIADADALPTLPFAAMSAWQRRDFSAQVERVAELQAKVVALGRPVDHPFHRCGLRRILPADEDALAALLVEASGRFEAAVQTSATLAQVTDQPPPPDLDAATALRDLARRFVEAPDIDGLDVASAEWVERHAAIEGALVLVAEIAERVEAHPDVVEEAWHSDLLVTPAALLECRREHATYGPKWWRVFSGRYRAARRQLRQLCTVEPPVGEEAVVLLDDMLAVRRRQQTLADDHPLCARLFRTRWKGWQSPVTALRAAFAWVVALHREVPEAVTRATRAWDRGALERARLAAADADAKLRAVLSRLGDALVCETMPSWSVTDLGQTLGRWTERRADLRSRCTYNDLAARCREAGLDDVVDLAEAWPDAGRRLVDAFTAGWYGGLIRTAEAERAAFADFDRARHEHVRTRFAELDRQSLGDHRAHIAADHFAQLPRGGVGEMGLLRREMAKKARHMPIRQLLREAGEAVQRIKPVFMMSPLSIATYLAPDGPRFDLVVFDEASQVRPVDALGAIIRADQAVVVGDDKQMPPTRFFERVVDGDDLDPDSANVTADLESILDLFVAAGAPSRTLRWHYRSRHPSLVAVSNRLFYGDALVLFPGTGRDDRDLGLRLTPVPDGVYDRGGTRTNEIEAQAVARAVLEHAARSPQRTLGVVAFSTAQTDAIRHALERLRRENLEHERFFGAHPHEPFFVKNLENVQGDERDVVFVSVGYGRGADGRIVLNFGPLNLVGGQRRLNVLMTRSRLRCEMFTHLQAEDIDLSRTGAEGVHALRTFLEFARIRAAPAPPAHGGDASAFERALQSRMTAAGHEVHRRVGTAGLHVDLAVVDPGDDARYRLAIECDGATYAGSHTTRERERLRQEVLRRLGWRVHRAWSVAAMRDLDGAVERAAAAMATQVAPVDDTVAVPTRSGTAEAALTPYPVYDHVIRFGKQGIDGATPERFARELQSIVAHEGPLLLLRLARRVVECSPEVPRFGDPVMAAVERAVAEAKDALWRVDLTDVYGVEQTYIWPQDPASWSPAVRERSGADREDRRSEALTPQERQAALVYVVWSAGSVMQEELLPAVVRALGLPRGEADSKTLWNADLERVVKDGRLHRRRKRLTSRRSP